MQQMSHPRSKEAMNNCDNHCTMASFINVWVAQTLGRLACLSIFCSEGLFLLERTGVSAEWCHRWLLSCLCVFVSSGHIKNGTSPCESVHEFGWEWELLTQCQWQCFHSPHQQRLTFQYFIMKTILLLRQKCEVWRDLSKISTVRNEIKM